MKLYKGNKLDGLVIMSHDEILEGFKESRFNSDDMPLECGLSFYIALSEGLNSAFDVKEFDELLVAAVIWKNKELLNES